MREQISLTGQFSAVDPMLTGRENLILIGKLRHLPDIKKQTEELLERFDLLEAADRLVATYSGGMSRRLDLAMSLLGSPSVIFLDEPTTGLDPQSRIAMWKMINNLNRSGITVFLTTQYLEEADRLADHIAILHEGKIVAEGSSAQLKKLLPGGHIELRFNEERDLLSAQELLQKYKITTDGQNQTLSVITDGSVKQMTEILNTLEQAGIDVAEFAQKLPSIEDVFLTIVSKTSREERNEFQNKQFFQ